MTAELLAFKKGIDFAISKCSAKVAILTVASRSPNSNNYIAQNILWKIYNCSSLLSVQIHQISSHVNIWQNEEVDKAATNATIHGSFVCFSWTLSDAINSTSLQILGKSSKVRLSAHVILLSY